MSFQLAKESVSDIRCDAVVNFVSPAELAETSFRVSDGIRSIVFLLILSVGSLPQWTMRMK